MQDEPSLDFLSGIYFYAGYRSYGRLAKELAVRWPEVSFDYFEAGCLTRALVTDNATAFESMITFNMLGERSLGVLRAFLLENSADGLKAHYPNVYAAVVDELGLATEIFSLSEIWEGMCTALNTRLNIFSDMFFNCAAIQEAIVDYFVLHRDTEHARFPRLIAYLDMIPYNPYLFETIEMSFQDPKPVVPVDVLRQMTQDWFGHFRHRQADQVVIDMEEGEIPSSSAAASSAWQIDYLLNIFRE